MMIFPTNVQAVTVWEKTVQNRAPTYIRHQLGAVYWEDTHGQRIQNGKSREPDDAVFLAIPVHSIGDYIPKTDDRIMKGIVEDASPPQAALTVMSVKDFLYGSEAMQHIEVTAK